MFKRELFTEDHEAFRDMVRRFIAKEIAPFHDEWEAGVVPRELWRKAGAAGPAVLHRAGTIRRCRRRLPVRRGGVRGDGAPGFTGPGFMIHCDLVATYIASFGSEAQKRRWLPAMVKGEAIGSLGMTEPHAGLDLKAIRTKAVRDGDDFVISGQKVFISNGQLCDVIVLATKTDSAAGAKGVTLFLVDTSLPGFRRGKNLRKVGMKAQDTRNSSSTTCACRRARCWARKAAASSS